MPRARFLLAIPVHNEEYYLPGVLAESRRYIGHILVIDDGSTDATSRILRHQQGLHLITHHRNQGYGRSLADAFAFARRKRFDWLITMDCDEQHEPLFIPMFIAATQASGTDVVSGSRYLTDFDHNTSPPADRRHINARITELLNQRLGLALTDAFCGFKAYRVAALSALNITEPGYAMPMQFWVQAARRRLAIRELAVPLIYRDPGRQFGGALNDPATREAHYVAVMEAELARKPGEPVGTPGAAAVRAAS